MSSATVKMPPSPCAKLLLALFGAIFLIVLLSVPVTTSTAQMRQDPASRLIFRTVYPEKRTMFLPSYLAARARAGGDGTAPRLRTAQWAGTMAIIVVLGLFDYMVFCRLLRKRRTGPPEDDDGQGDQSSGTTLFP